MAYCIDTSSLIESWVRHYPYDVFPSLWDRLAEAIQKGSIIGSAEVLREIERKDDALAEWIAPYRDLFREIDNETQIIVRALMKEYPRLAAARLDQTRADPFVIALAIDRGLTVVTEERERNNSIPSICKAQGIDCIPIVQLMRELGWRY